MHDLQFSRRTTTTFGPSPHCWSSQEATSKRFIGVSPNWRPNPFPSGEFGSMRFVMRFRVTWLRRTSRRSPANFGLANLQQQVSLTAAQTEDQQVLTFGQLAQFLDVAHAASVE